MSRILPQPSVEQAKYYLDSIDVHYVAQDRALRKLISTFPNNTELDEVLLKSSTLNDFYSTNIFFIYSMATHIHSLKNVDQRLKDGDLSLMDDMRKVTIQGKTKDFYSFSSKYCANHNPEAFPIYDSFVEKVLWYFQQKDKFSQFKRADLKIYAKFKQVLLDFQNYYKLGDFKLRELDTYLWLLGKEFFQKKA